MIPDSPRIAANRAAILTIILVSYVMIVLDTSVVLTGLPKIQAELGFTAAGLSWVQSAYTLTFGGFLLVGARAGDILGRRRMFVLGLGIFTLASLAIGVAQSPGFLIASRAIQGVGAAILAPSTLAILQTNFPQGPERTRAVAYYGASAGIGASVGLVLGGILADWTSWRVGFFVNLPIGIGMILATYRYISETERRPGRFDIVGGVTSTLGMTALVYGLVRSAESGWSDAMTLSSLGAGIAFLVAFVLNEGRVSQPIMPLRLFANRERIGAYVARVLFLGAMIGFFFFTTQFLQGVAGFDALQTGAAFLPMTVTNFVLAMMVPRLTQRFGNSRLLACGLAVTAVGMVWLSRVSMDPSYFLDIALPMVLVGFGQGITLSPLTVAGVKDVASADAGAASGIVNVAHQFGNSLGLAVLVAVAGVGAGSLGGRQLLAYRAETALEGSSVMLVLALLAVLLLIVRPTRNPRTSTLPEETFALPAVAPEATSR
ncbi:MFS transporter [Aureimonas endophytica]|uniref:MFS transporter n=1 Tax=Aureimonas endophytica TaxID=2027858 RepID=A0A916ZKZ1_9HYPH|nr:MFS transporter [Aureimonas endophytica]GGE02812.1 MFS transporter [Aureimonas endophytica]